MTPEDTVNETDSPQIPSGPSWSGLEAHPPAVGGEEPAPPDRADDHEPFGDVTVGGPVDGPDGDGLGRALTAGAVVAVLALGGFLGLRALGASTAGAQGPGGGRPGAGGFGGPPGVGGNAPGGGAGNATARGRGTGGLPPGGQGAGGATGTGTGPGAAVGAAPAGTGG